MKSYECKISTNFYDDGMPKGSLYSCLSVILIDSVFKIGNNFDYNQEILE